MSKNEAIIIATRFLLSYALDDAKMMKKILEARNYALHVNDKESIIILYDMMTELEKFISELKQDLKKYGQEADGSES